MEKVDAILEFMKQEFITPFDLLQHLLNESNSNYGLYRSHLYHEDCDRLFSILNTIALSRDGQRRLQEWLQCGVGLKSIMDLISDEMDKLHGLTQMRGLADINPDYVESWDIIDFKTEASFTFKLIRSAAESRCQCEVNIAKSPEYELISAKGLKMTWDSLGNISAAIHKLNKIKKKIAEISELSHLNHYHSQVDTSDLVWHVAKKSKEESFQIFKEKHHGNTKVNIVIDLVEEGSKKLKSLTLSTFNAKFKLFASGQPTDFVGDTNTLGNAED
ncbi:hypothetical protein BDQ17DRAFT_1434511 [Cyathus striatus]|nr:hypothetical protein BDQ17DRAFT_1434511 [Cyathus striatus]